jgi:ketosteroid isomerase-like protein
MKVRISGTISLLTNDTSLNRTFYFLDTFNKTGGKWRAIASSISPVPAIGAQEAREELLKLENGRSQAVLSGDVSALERLIAPEFVSTSFQGQAEDRGQWITAQKTQRIKSSVLSEMRVDLVSDNVAVVTGVETSVGSIDNEAEVTNADRFTHTWARRGGRWQCVAAHVTRIK